MSLLKREYRKKSVVEETLLERFEPLHLDWNYIESHHWAHHAFAQSTVHHSPMFFNLHPK